MSISAISGASSGSAADSSAAQSDFQVKQLQSQIHDWSTCPTTPPDMKKSIVAKLQAQLDTLVAGIENRQAAVKAANKQSAQSGASIPTSGQPTVAPRFVSPFRVDVSV